ncbi:MAG: urease accessory protein UreF [Marinifilaceae bacterium]
MARNIVIHIVAAHRQDIIMTIVVMTMRMTITTMKNTTKLKPMANNVTRLMHLLEFADSAFPVGTFSFSNGLESASFEGIVVDAKTLEQYTDTVVQQSLYSDAIVALNAFRAASKGDYATILEADRQLFMCKMNMEARQMLTRMGKKMAEITTHITSVPLMKAWLEDINKQATPGTYPVAQAIFFEHNGLTEEDLFVAIIYGAANMVLNAALRCVKVSHYETQAILYRLCEKAQHQYDAIKEFTFDDIRSFAPEMDVLASIHEKGNMRMFMN